MSTSTRAVEVNGAQPGWPDRAGGGRPSGRRRSVPHLLVGVLLVLVCAVAFLLITVQSGGRRAVLVLARPVTVGQVLTVADLRPVDVGVDDGAVGVVAADAAASVVGRPAATSLPAGALLSPALVGAPLLPGPGQAVVAVAVKPGQVPAEVSAGAAVLVVAQPAASPLPGAALPGSVRSADSVPGWSAVVTSVSPSSADGQVMVASLRMRQADAREVAAVAPGQLSIVLVSGSGGG